MDDKVAIVGMGYVGTAMLRIFPDAVQYDEPRGIGSIAHVDECDLAIVCVPTPPKDDGGCDTSIVERVCADMRTPLVLIKSAVAPGTTDRIQAWYKGGVAVSPEYIGESRYYVPDRFLDPRDPLKHEFLILGGRDDVCGRIADVFAPRVGPACRIRIMRAIEAEIVKYAENSFFATKVAFAQELRDVCEALGASWHRVREGWVDDPRVGPMHTAVFPRDRGFSGKCLPKDISALCHVAEAADVKVPLLRGVVEDNAGRRRAD